jgi:hypothetical protein
MALPYQCAQCLARAVPAATDVAMDVVAMVGTYCYNPVRTPTPFDFRTLRQVEGFAEDSTYKNKCESYSRFLICGSLFITLGPCPCAANPE